MAAPTVWGFTGVAGVTTTFPIEGTNLYGVDIAGTLAPKSIKLVTGVHLLLTAETTDAALVAALQDFIKRMGTKIDGAAGGVPAQTTIQQALALTTTS